MYCTIINILEYCIYKLTSTFYLFFKIALIVFSRYAKTNHYLNSTLLSLLWLAAVWYVRMSSIMICHDQTIGYNTYPNLWSSESKIEGWDIDISAWIIDACICRGCTKRADNGEQDEGSRSSQRAGGTELRVARSRPDRTTPTECDQLAAGCR